MFLEQTRLRGRRNPSRMAGAGQNGTELLDLMVGEPVAYATGSSELKATGPFRDGFELPDHQESGRIIAGAHRKFDLLPGEEAHADGIRFQYQCVPGIIRTSPDILSAGATFSNSGLYLFLARASARDRWQAPPLRIGPVHQGVS